MASEGEGYVLRVHCLINNVGMKSLQEVIQHYCRDHGDTFQSFLGRLDIQHRIFHFWRPKICCQCKNTIRQYQQIFTKEQFEILYSKHGSANPNHSVGGKDSCSCPYIVNVSADVKSLDITMATAILLNLDIVDKEEARHILKLREFRNIFNHKSSTTLILAEFQKEWRAIEQCIKEVTKVLSSTCQRDLHAEIQSAYSNTLDANLLKKECSAKDWQIEKAVKNIEAVTQVTSNLRSLAEELQFTSGITMTSSNVQEKRVEDDGDSGGDDDGLDYPVGREFPPNLHGQYLPIIQYLTDNSDRDYDGESKEHHSTPIKESESKIQYPLVSKQMFDFKDRQLKIAISLLGREADDGHFDTVESFVLHVIKKKPANKDVIPGITYFHAGALLQRGKYDNAEKVARWGLKKCIKSSEPRYFSFQLHTILARASYFKNEPIQHRNLLEEEEQMIESDKVYFGGISAGWFFANRGLYFSKQLSMVRRRSPRCEVTIRMVYENCKKCFKLAIENFQRDTFGNGQRFICAAVHYLTILILRCGIDGKEMHLEGPCSEELQEAKKYLDKIEHSNVRFVKIDKIYFLLARCDYFFRCNVPGRALEYAEDARALAVKMKWKTMEDAAKNREKYLSDIFVRAIGKTTEFISYPCE